MDHIADCKVQCAVGGSHIEVIQVLLQMGAEPYLENEHQE